jgi:cell division protein FtsL
MKFFKTLQKILSGELLKSIVLRNYLFLLFIAVLALVWIATTYSAMQTLREIKEVEEKLEVAAVNLKQQQNTYTKNSQPSQLVKQLENSPDSSKIKMAHSNTYKIIVDKNEGGIK